MIDALRGKVVSKGASHVIVDVGGIGFMVEMTSRSAGDILLESEEIVLVTHFHVRENEMRIFGFTDERERDIFRSLISISGVGPRLALSVLTVFKPAELISIVTSQDLESICTVPGVGAKSGRRLLLELKNRFDLEFAETKAVSVSGSSAEAVEALKALGYSGIEAISAMEGYEGDANAVDEIIKHALRKLSKNKS